MPPDRCARILSFGLERFQGARSDATAKGYLRGYDDRIRGATRADAAVRRHQVSYVKEVTAVDDLARSEAAATRSLRLARRITGRGRRAATRPRAVVADVQPGNGGGAGCRAKPLMDGDSDGKGAGPTGKRPASGGGWRDCLPAGNLVVVAGWRAGAPSARPVRASGWHTGCGWSSTWR